MPQLSRKKFFLATVLAMLVSTETRSETAANYCHSLPQLAKNVKTCGQNVIFAKAAHVCLEKIEKDIEAKKALLALAMTASSAQAGSAQAARMQNNAQNLANLRTSIETLTGYAVQARQEMVNYSASFDIAGPFSPKQAEKLGILKLLTGFPCFKKNRAILASAVQTLDTRITEFRGVIANAKALEARTAVAQTKLDSSTINQKAAANRAPAAIGAPQYAPPPPKEKQGPSSITGTEKIGESEEALNKILGGK